MLKPVRCRCDRDRETDDETRSDRELVEANRRMREFLALLGHELGNPLAAMRYALCVLQLHGDDVVDRDRTWGVMDRQLQFITALVKDLTDVSGIELGKMQLHIQPLNLAEAVVRAVECVRTTIEGSGHRLDVALPPDSVRLDADPVRLEQVLTNLLTNAAKYADAGGRIWLTAEVDGGDVVFHVRDTGIGLSPEVLPHVFEPFWQAEQTGARRGLGIGLPLVRKLAELHGGSVSAHSEGLGRGSEFVVRLPLHGERLNETRPDPCGWVATGRQE